MNKYFDIETGKAEDLEIFKPEFTEPKTKTAKSAADKEREWYEDVPMHPFTGRVIIIGMLDDNELYQWTEGQEKDMLEAFWDSFNVYDNYIGFDVKRFDFPFLLKRSWKHGIKTPKLIKYGRYWEDNIIDIREILACGEYQPHGNLDDYSKFFGLGSKGSGAGFEDLFKADKGAALQYNKGELIKIKSIYNKII